MAVLHALLLHRRNFSSAAFANDMFWSHVDLSSSIEQFRIIMLLCQRFKGTRPTPARLQRSVLAALPLLLYINKFGWRYFGMSNIILFFMMYKYFYVSRTSVTSKLSILVYLFTDLRCC